MQSKIDDNPLVKYFQSEKPLTISVRYIVQMQVKMKQKRYFDLGLFLGDLTLKNDWNLAKRAVILAGYSWNFCHKPTM